MIGREYTTDSSATSTLSRRSRFQWRFPESLESAGTDCRLLSRGCIRFIVWRFNGARASRGRRRFSDYARGSEDIIRGMLRLCGCVDQELTIIAKLFEPAGHVCSLIVDDHG